MSIIKKLKEEFNHRPLLAIFDCDDVLLEFIPAFIKFVYKNFGTLVRIEDFNSYEFSKVFNVSQEKMNFWMDRFYESEEFANLCTESGAPELIDLFYHVEALLVCITARTSGTEHVTRKQIWEMYSSNFSKVLFTKNSLTGERLKKSEIIRSEFGYVDMFIDDAGHNAVDVAENFPEAIVILLRRNWNKDYQIMYDLGTLPQNLVILDSLYEAISYLFADNEPTMAA